MCYSWVPVKGDGMDNLGAAQLWRSLVVAQGLGYWLDDQEFKSQHHQAATFEQDS